MTNAPTPVKLLNLKDLAVGQKFVSDTYKIEAAEIKQFAAQFDPQPFHTDEVAATKSRFGGLVASGWHTASVSMRLIVQSLPLECGLIGLGGTIAWLHPVRPGTIIHVESEIIEITPSRSKPNQAVMVARCVTYDQDGKPVIEISPKLMVFGSP